MKAHKTIFGLAAILVLLLVAAAAALFLWSRGGRPARSGEHLLAGLEATVTVRWDRWGVPAILAASEDDLAAGLGWIHANDRITQMELGRRATAGRLSEILGDATFELDVYFRTHRFAPVAAEIWQSAEPRSRRWLEAYARGVNAWLEERGNDLPPELRLLGVEPEPWQPADSIAFALLMARDLSFWNDRPEEERFRWLRAFGPDAVRELLGEPELHIPDEILAMARDTDPRNPEAAFGGPSPPSPLSQRERGSRAEAAFSGAVPSPGSNNWAMAPARTATGRALVANDPHLALFLPSVWYQVHLRAPGFEAAGMSLPGAPAVVLGRGAHLGWAFTNTMLDDHDVFFETLDESGDRYRRGDEWLALEATEETIRIRGGEERRVRIRSTDRGPLLEADEERGLPPRSLAWTAYEGGDPLNALLELAGAATVDEVLAAIETYYCPAQNLVVALESGEILFTVLGRVPQRRLGDGRLPSPGWDPAYGWDGVRPRETNPFVLDPQGGLIVTANHDVRPEGYEGPLVAEFFPGHRARRIRERLEEGGPWDWETIGQLQGDVVSLYAADLLDTLTGGTYEGEAGEAWEAFAGWDRAMTSHGTAALYALLERELLGIFADEAEAAGFERPIATRATLLRLLRGEMDERWFDDVATVEGETRSVTIARALATAWREGRERWGRDVERWNYAEIHQLTLRHRLDAVPFLGGWLRRGPFDLPGSATTVAAFGARWEGDRMSVAYGPSMRWITDWSQGDLAFAMLPGGQSGHGADPHYDDQVGPFLAGRLRPVPWSEEQIEATSLTTLILEP